MKPNWDKILTELSVKVWDKYGDKDYATDFDYGDLVDMYTGDSK